MITYRDVVYILMDEAKILSDDSSFESEHFIQIINKYRALLFTQKYKGKKVEIPFAWYQRLNVNIDTSTNESGVYSSNISIPNVLDTGNLWQYTFVKENIVRPW